MRGSAFRQNAWSDSSLLESRPAEPGRCALENMLKTAFLQFRRKYSAFSMFLGSIPCPIWSRAPASGLRCPPRPIRAVRRVLCSVKGDVPFLGGVDFGNAGTGPNAPRLSSWTAWAKQVALFLMIARCLELLPGDRLERFVVRHVPAPAFGVAVVPSVMVSRRAVVRDASRVLDLSLSWRDSDPRLSTLLKILAPLGKTLDVVDLEGARLTGGFERG